MKITHRHNTKYWLESGRKHVEYPALGSIYSASHSRITLGTYLLNFHTSALHSFLSSASQYYIHVNQSEVHLQAVLYSTARNHRSILSSRTIKGSLCTDRLDIHAYRHQPWQRTILRPLDCHSAILLRPCAVSTVVVQPLHTCGQAPLKDSTASSTMPTAVLAILTTATSTKARMVILAV